MIWLPSVHRSALVLLTALLVSWLGVSATLIHVMYTKNVSFMHDLFKGAFGCLDESFVDEITGY
jgi:hypothetical protein